MDFPLPSWLETVRPVRCNRSKSLCRGTRTLYVSGQVGVAADGSIPSDAEAQCALAWRNLQAQLRAAGMETTIVRDPADTVAVRTGRAAVLGTHSPASTLTIGGLSNPAWKVEVEGIAVA